MVATITVALTCTLTCAGLWALTQRRFWAWATGMLTIFTVVATLGGLV